jgi:NADPH-dependent ferric siderophore reductase
MRVIESFITDPTHFILSGKAQSIQFVSRALKERGIPPRRLRTKAYWAPGKKGLD